MYKTDDVQDNRLVSLLQDGAVGVMPTDTLYGLVCCAADQSAVERLYDIKSRQNKPGTVIAASVDQLVALGIPRRYLTAVEHYWPGAISVVVPTTPALAYLDQGKMSLAVRVPANQTIVTLLQKTGALLTTSANAPAEPPASTIVAAQVYFDDTVDFYVDGGDVSTRSASTIIRVVDDAVEVIRQGAVKMNERG